MIQMPDYIGEVYPFRFVEVKGYKGMLKAPQVVRTMINYTFDGFASSFDSSDVVLNQIWDFCKYSMKATGSVAIISMVTESESLMKPMLLSINFLTML